MMCAEKLLSGDTACLSVSHSLTLSVCLSALTPSLQAARLPICLAVYLQLQSCLCLTVDALFHPRF